MNKNQFKLIPVLQNTNVAQKVCLVRLDLNVPIKKGKILDNARIIAAKATLDHLIHNKCKIVILSHLSRIKEAKDITSNSKSLSIVAKELQQIYPKLKITFIPNNIDHRLPTLIKKMNCNEILLLENTRYNDFDLKNNKLVKNESKNNLKLAKFWASLADVYVNDAFATIHRCHASNAGIASLVKEKCIGFLIQEELENIIKFNKYSSKPIVSIIGGAKIKDKIILLEKLFEISDQVIIGGGMVFTFLKSLGVNVGKSLVEDEMLQIAKNIYTKYKNKIILPVDVACANDFANQEREEFLIKNIPNNKMGLDVGTRSIKIYKKYIKLAHTIFWNGPTGVYEFSNFSNSTKEIAQSIAEATKTNYAFSLIGGGDTAAAATKFAPKTDFSWVSTGGGATLAVIQDDKLPGLFFDKK